MLQTAESLVELVKAVMWSAGNVAAAARSGENTATAELCLVRRWALGAQLAAPQPPRSLARPVCAQAGCCLWGGRLLTPLVQLTS